ncbi:hypothetical protein [Parasitella parasitica]|uniref:Uncharacterized protein n=1 Tax=Parasitella parasitica TaxID=35722 RepID=A0A0B7MY58_9FUNG|nr:hypothetical protein [Parasitella parasitica]
MRARDFHLLDSDTTDRILQRLTDWRRAICPNGTLAPEPCFVLSDKPCIYIHPDNAPPSQQAMTTEFVTEWDWADNLIINGAIAHMNDMPVMRAVSDFFSIFHASTDMFNNQNTLHSIQLWKHASFRVGDVARPTEDLQLRLDQVLSEPDPAVQWTKLLDLWNTYGYFWPRKLELGYKRHVKQAYAFASPSDSLNAFYLGCDKIREQYYKMPQMPEFDLEQFLAFGTIVSRVDIAPLHEFLEEKTCQAITDIINARFTRIPVYHPIKIYNVVTNSYLCWGSASQSGPLLPGEQPGFVVRAISADTVDSDQPLENQYLWRLAWSHSAVRGPKPKHLDIDLDKLKPRTVRGLHQVYIYPAYPTKTLAKPRSHLARDGDGAEAWEASDSRTEAPDVAETDVMPLACQQEYRVPNKHYSRLRGLQLLPSDPAQHLDDRIDWKIQYPYDRLRYTTKIQADIRLNFNEHIRRIKPVLENDTIRLQQLGLLTAFRQSAKTPSADDLSMQDSQLQSPASSISTGRPTVLKNVLCVDEDITSRRFQESTHWKIRLATANDTVKHSNYFYRSPETTATEQQPNYPSENPALPTQDLRDQLAAQRLDGEAGSLTSTATGASSLRRPQFRQGALLRGAFGQTVIKSTLSVCEKSIPAALGTVGEAITLESVASIQLL